MAEPLPPKEISVQGWAPAWNMGTDPPFHRKKVNEGLQKYSNLLFGDSPAKVFVPLCGKSVDMIYLAGLGHEVVGLEFSEFGVESFFKEQELTFTKQELEKDRFIVYKANEKKITIYRGDLFDLTPDICGLFDAFWDRGSYVAINMSQRMDYTDLMYKLMKPTSRYLLEAVEYDGSKFVGPPHYVAENAVKDTFGRKCSTEFLGRKRSRKPSLFPADDDIEYGIAHYMIKPKTDSSL